MSLSVTVSEWADKNRVLDAMTSAERGQWRTSRTPYLRGIMDVFTDPKIEKVTLMKSTQVGGTEAMLNCLAFCMDQDPGPALYVKPTDILAKSDCTDRIQPMVNSSPALKAHITGWDDDIQKLFVKLDHMILYLAGSNSPSSLASKSIRYLFLDEVDKFPMFAGREASPIDLAEERTRTFWNRRIMECSTPTTRDGYIFRSYEKSDKRWYYVPCPHCGEFQTLSFSHIKWPSEAVEPDHIKNEALARYFCDVCGGKIDDTQKIAMVLKGQWLKDGQTIDKNGVISGNPPHNFHAGFWINALYSPWLTFSDIACKFLNSKNEPEKLMNFVNSWLGEIWEEKIQETKPQQLRKHAQTYLKGTVPDGVFLLTAGVDVQKDHFYYVVRGWGLGWESWLVSAKRVETWEDVILDLFTTYYPREHGQQSFPVIMTCIDSGFNAYDVYDVCRNWRDCSRATKGHDVLTGVPYNAVNIEKFPGTNRPIPGGLQLYHLDTNYFKNKLHRWMTFDDSGVTKFHLYENIGDDYLNQICSERKIIERDTKGRAHEVWKQNTDHTPNHYLDCEVGAAAAAEMLRVYALTKEDRPRIVQPVEQHGYKQKPVNSWLGSGQEREEKQTKKGGWLNQ